MQILDSSLYIEREKILIISDLHLGQEEAYHRKGVLLPKVQLQEIQNRLKFIFEKADVHTVVINGDLKHNFGRIMTSEWREVRRLFSFLREYGKEIMVIEGNHDKTSKFILLEENLPLHSRYQWGEYLCIHGDEVEENIPKGVTTLIMGHEHPCVVLRHGMRKEKYKCFLFGKYKEYNLIVLPSFTSLTMGTDVLLESILSPYLKENIKTFSVYVYTEEGAKSFGTIGELQKLMAEEKE